MITVTKEIPRYQSHKIVWALKIQDIDYVDQGMAKAMIKPADIGYEPFSVSDEYVLKHQPKPGGYFVVYEGGYQSYSPAEPFESGNTLIGSEKVDNLTFGEATKFAEKGEMIARAGWNGSGMFAYIVPANSYPPSTDAMKKYFKGDLVPYRAYWALKTAQEDIATWTPSGSDTLAKDWMVVRL